MSWVFFKWDTHSAVSLPRPVDDITPWWHHKSETSSASFDDGATVCFTLQSWISTRHLMLRAALTPAAHMERPYWKIHMSQLRRNTRAASRTRDEARDESECVSSLIFQLMSPDEGNKRWCRSAGEDENVSECLFAPSSDCQAGRPHRLQTHRRRFLLITEPAVNLSLSFRTTSFIPKRGFH